MMVCNLRTSNSRNHEKSVSLRWELRSGNSRPKARLHKMPRVTNDSVLCADCAQYLSHAQASRNVLPATVDGFADHCRQPTAIRTSGKPNGVKSCAIKRSQLYPVP